MSKKRAIVSYDKLSIEQKKELLKAFPDGYSGSITQIKTPTGETLDALYWETEEVIYLVKVNRLPTKPIVNDDDDDEDDDLDDIEDVKGKVADEDLDDDSDDDDEYDKPEEKDDDEDEDDEE